MQILLVDQYEHRFFPLCLTRPVSSLRTGISTTAEKWGNFNGDSVGFLTRSILEEKFNADFEGDFWAVDGAVVPNESLYQTLQNLKIGESVLHNGKWIASRVNSIEELNFNPDQLQSESISFEGEFLHLERIQDLFLKCAELIAQDFQSITRGRASEVIDDSNKIIGPLGNLFVEKGARIIASIINVEEGPVYIGKDALVMEGSLIRGPFSLGDSSHLKMGTKIYGPSVIGPHCKVGGEISNSVIQGYSNKAHDGFLGNSVIGEWCNLGADTNTSNLKNNYGEVRSWDFETLKYENTGLTFSGLLMGDHSKCSINTMFNTGTTVGVSANIFGSGFPPKYIPSFSWGGSSGLSTYNLEKAFEVAEKVMARRNVIFTEADRDILSKISEESADL